ncbi:MAG: ABC transporter ATP-binding protein [Candidatus Electrothrix aestuarii]|uniref:ABC transporter ATP-binding protein n=1 Tax=Candidatus Electrothrix aestuarii TaxID=3062594 RepID=A0AAU8LXN8_9BACT|nr:ABC transporter ATP-binding protein [Candidatus Electrothrix aestuarii]
MSTVITIENLWKEYRLGIIGHGNLAQDLQSWWARIRGKDDPNSQIVPMLAGQEKQIEGDRFWALRGVNLEVKEGDILGIIGRNGAGKSTLLKLLSRVTAPTKGQVKVKGRIASLLEVGTGFHPELTGRENIFMNGAILGMSKQEIRSKLDEIIDFSGVESFVDTPVKRYSSGMYVRLAFAVAAHLEPEILIIDEVLAVGDAEFQKKCLGKMGNVAKEGRTVLFVSHNMNAVNNLCSDAVYLQDGSVVLRGEPTEVIDNYLSVGRDDEVTSVEFPEDDEKDFQVLSAGITVNGVEPPNGIIKVDQSFSVQLLYKIRKPLPGGFGTFTIRNQRDEVIFFSDNRDGLGGETNALEQPGLVDMRVDIPLPLLVPGKYSLSMALAKQGTGAIDWYRDVIRFELVDTEGIRGHRGGYIFKPLHWHLTD